MFDDRSPIYQQIADKIKDDVLRLQRAAFRPDPAGATLFPAIAADPHEVSQFLGVLTGRLLWARVRPSR